MKIYKYFAIFITLLCIFPESHGKDISIKKNEILVEFDRNGNYSETIDVEAKILSQSAIAMRRSINLKKTNNILHFEVVQASYKNKLEANKKAEILHDTDQGLSIVFRDIAVGDEIKYKLRIYYQAIVPKSPSLVYKFDSDMKDNPVEVNVVYPASLELKFETNLLISTPRKK